MNISLWPACVKTHTFEQQLIAASNAGFSHVPIGLTTYNSLKASGETNQSILSMAADNNVKLGHFDGFSAWAPVRFNDDFPAAAKAVFDINTQACLDICDQLQLPAICATGTYFYRQFEPAQLAECFAQFCQQARALNIRVDLEFLPMWGIPTLDEAWSIVKNSAADNAGILLDTWHFLKGKPNMALLESLPAGSITSVQLADAMLTAQSDDLFEECLRYRKPPGEGELNLHQILSILANKGGVMDIGPEIFSDQLDLLDATTAAQHCYSQSLKTLHNAGWHI
ncbi:MAG: sugar phosphate isomerase/epimerase [Spongiibacteraceae bacterium]